MSASNPNQIGPGQPVTTVTTADLGATPTTPPSPSSTGNIVQVPGGAPPEMALLHPSQNADPAAGTGTEGEEDVWTSRYSMLNFLDRIIIRVVLTLALIFIAVKAWGSQDYESHDFLRKFSYLLAGIVAIMWIYLGFRMMRAWYSHYYRLTTRRLFVSSGIIRRRRDMLELLRVNDVYTRQGSLLDRWLGLGTVVVVSNEKGTPTFYLPGVKDPKAVLDLIWHHARSERDQRTVKVDQV